MCQAPAREGEAVLNDQVSGKSNLRVFISDLVAQLARASTSVLCRVEPSGSSPGLPVTFCQYRLPLTV